MRDHVCPFCQSDQTEEISYSEEVKIGRRKVRITDIKKMHCHACDSEFVSGALHDENLARTRTAIENTPGAVSPAMLRTYREDWNLSQKDASALFGAGSSAFAKWESGQTQPSTPSALLLQTAMKFPQVTTHLAQLADVKLSKDIQASGYQFRQQHYPLNVVIPRVQSPAFSIASAHDPDYAASYSFDRATLSLAA